YTQALRAAASAVRGGRKAEWQFAREAASVIARGKLGDSTLTDQVADVLSDAAGALAIRDLLSPAEFSLVLLPWTWRGTVKMPDLPAAAGATRADVRAEPVRVTAIDPPTPPVAAPIEPPKAPVAPATEPPGFPVAPAV